MKHFVQNYTIMYTNPFLSPYATHMVHQISLDQLHTVVYNLKHVYTNYSSLMIQPAWFCPRYCYSRVRTSTWICWPNTRPVLHTVENIDCISPHCLRKGCILCLKSEHISNWILYCRLHTVNTANTFVETNESIQQMKYSTLFQSWTAVNGYKRSTDVAHI